MKSFLSAVEHAVAAALRDYKRTKDGDLHHQDGVQVHDGLALSSCSTYMAELTICPDVPGTYGITVTLTPTPSPEQHHQLTSEGWWVSNTVGPAYSRTISV